MTVYTDQIDKIKKITEVFDINKIITSEEIGQALEAITGILAVFKRETETLNSETRNIIENSLFNIKSTLDNALFVLNENSVTQNDSIKTRVEQGLKDINLANIESKTSIKKLLIAHKNAQTLYTKLTEFKALNGEDGKTPIKGVDYFTDKEKEEFIKEIQDTLEVDNKEGENIKTKLEELETTIKNLPARTIGGGSGITEAPKDGKTYGRQNRKWVEVAGGTGGGASNFTDLGDKTTADLPTINTPLANALATKATQTDIDNSIAALVDSSPTTLNTLNELANALGDDPNYATTVSTQIGLKEDSANKATTVTGNEASNIKFPTIKAIYDWATGLFATQSSLNSHTSNTSNPHSVTKAQVGLSNVDNTSDTNKPISTATQSALDGKASTSHTHTIDDLSDVVINTPTTGQVIKYNGTNWVNDTDATGGGGGVTDHGALTGLGDDDHTQYHTDARGDARYYQKSEVDTALTGKVTSNTAITGATKTKISYDAKGLVTAGADATTADIADSTNKRYVTDAQLTVISNTSNTNTGDETTATIKTKLGITTLSGSNTGDQTSIVGITGTIAQFNTALTDGDFATLAGTETLTNKTISSSKIIRRVSSTTSTATLTPTYATYDDYQLTAQAAALTIANPTGTPNDGEQFIVRIKDNGTIRSITFGTAYRAIGVTLPTTTVASKTTYIGCKYNATDTKVDVIAVAQEA